MAADVRRLADEHVAAPVAHDLAVALHRGDAPLEAVERLRALHAEAFGKALGPHRHALFGERLEDAFPGGNLHRVGGRFIGPAIQFW